ncbi:hypothetical protein L7F22_026145 [Adiantum nelumboides]|nr:hypothetical protein [Adiantum nelumboides]
MGVAFTKLVLRIWGRSQMRVLMVGLNGAGKTTVLYKLKLGEAAVATTPTIVFVISQYILTTIKPGREDNNKPSVRAQEQVQQVALLVLANKQDLPHAMNAEELADHLGLYSLAKRTWYIQRTSATTGAGLFEGLDWLVDNVAYI